MSPIITAYAALAAAICLEVTGSTFLQKSEQFTKLIPSVLVVICFVAAFYCLSLALKAIPLGVAYAIWAGVGIVLTAIVGFVVFGIKLDLPAIAGIALIVSGVVVMNLFSNSVAH